MLVRAPIRTVTVHQSDLLRPVMPELDTMRGIAVLGVLLLHGFEWQFGASHFGTAATLAMEATGFGSLGVNLFFVLSGFLITGILLDSKGVPGYYARFYTRRALRILPAYYALLALLWFLHSSSRAFIALSAIYLSNMTSFFAVACDYGPLWSLAVEEHFYLLWPAFVRRLTTRTLATVSGAIMVFIPVLRLTCFLAGWGKASLGWYTWFVADGLAAGSLVAIALRYPFTRSSIKKADAGLLAGSALTILMGFPLGITSKTHALGAALQQTATNLLFTGILLLFLLAGTSRFKVLVNIRALRFFGYISYGLYLDHLLAFRIYDRPTRAYFPDVIPSDYRFDLVMLRFVVAGSTAVLVAFVSRKYFEEIFLRWKNRIAPTAVSASTRALVCETSRVPVAS